MIGLKFNLIDQKLVFFDRRDQFFGCFDVFNKFWYVWTFLAPNNFIENS